MFRGWSETGARSSDHGNPVCREGESIHYTVSSAGPSSLQSLPSFTSRVTYTTNVIWWSVCPDLPLHLRYSHHGLDWISVGQLPTHTHTHCRYAFWINKMSNNIYVIILFVNDKRRDWEEWGLWLLGICKIWQIHILNECDVCRWRYTCAPVRISMCSLYTEKKKKRKEKDKTCCYHLSFSSK